MQYSNFRKDVTISDWPYGSYRTTAYFHIQSDPKRGERAARTTVNPRNRKLSAPKFGTYSPHVRIADGEDGRTYILSLTEIGFIHVMRGDMKYQHEAIFERDERFVSLKAEMLKD